MDTRERLVSRINFAIRQFKPRPKFHGAARWFDDEKITLCMAEAVADALLNGSGLKVELKPEAPVEPASFPDCPRGF